MKKLTKGVAHACMHETEALNQNKQMSGSYSLEEVHSACVELCRRFGFDRFFYISKKPSKPVPRMVLVQGEANSTKSDICRAGYQRLGLGSVFGSGLILWITHEYLSQTQLY